ncbi:MAG: hypothetical protein ISR69_05890 [Gammaproteobacteria bacterium]|nr:hypothetical protein [Gammaproteobacteria bacterium]
MPIKIQFFFLSIVISLSTNSADSINKWKWGGAISDPSNPFNIVDPKSRLITDPADNAMDPVSILLSDPLNVRDPKSIKILEVIKQDLLISETVVVSEGSQSKTTSKTTRAVKKSFDSDGNTVTKTYDVCTDIKAIPVTTTTTKVTTKVTTYADGSIAKEVVDSNTTSKLGEKVIEVIPKCKKMISTKITPNIKDTWLTEREVKEKVSGKTTISSTHVDQKIESMDENGSTIIDTYRIYTDTITAPIVMKITTITTQHTLWTNGEIKTKDTETTKEKPLSSTTSTKTRKVHVNREVIPNIVSTNDIQEIATKIYKGSPNIDSDCSTREEAYRDDDKNTTITTYETCVNVITTPITTIKTTVTKRNTLWTDRNTTSKVIDTHEERSTISTTTTNITEDIIGTRLIDYQQLTLKEGEEVLKDYIKSQGSDPETMSDSELGDLSALICQELKIQGIGFTQNPIFYDSSHNWNDPSGFEKLYDMIEKCLRG